MKTINYGLRLIAIVSVIGMLLCAGCVSRAENKTIAGKNVTPACRNSSLPQTFQKEIASDNGTYSISASFPIMEVTQDMAMGRGNYSNPKPCPDAVWRFEFLDTGSYRAKNTSVFDLSTKYTDLSELNITVVKPDGTVAYARNLKVVSKDGGFYLEGDHRGFSDVGIGELPLLSGQDWDKEFYQPDGPMDAPGSIILQGEFNDSKNNTK